MKTPKLCIPINPEANIRQLNGLKKGSLVTVSTGRDRFWVQVRSVQGASVLGAIDSDVEFSEGLKFGDEILFGKEHIYKVDKRKSSDEIK
jgi:hypothetical protein